MTLKKNDTALVPVFFLFLSILCVGLFYEWGCCLCSAVLCLVLWLKSRKRELKIWISPELIAVATLLLFMLLGTTWGVDKGSGIIGFLKFLPVLLFIVLLQQYPGSQEKIKTVYPRVMAVLTPPLLVLMYIPLTSEYVTVAGRFAGTFQYPNTFAMALLMALLLAIDSFQPTVIHGLQILSLLAGFLLTGSRTTLLIAVFSIAMLLFLKGRKKEKILIAIAFSAGILLLVIANCFFSAEGILGRYLSLSLSSSTFRGRLLYFYDALPVILKHPFGLGYLGYHYMQSSFQTGVYSVMYIHNEFLQILLDVGFLPFIVLLIALIKFFRSKDNPILHKIVILSFCLHCCMDFDCQFVAMPMLAVSFMNLHSGKTISIRRPGKCAILLPTVLLSLYFSLALGLSCFRQYDVSHTLYPYNTQNELCRLAENTPEKESIANDILKVNSYASAAYVGLAECAYSEGDVTTMMSCQRKALNLAPLAGDIYTEYMEMLIVVKEMYKSQGSEKSEQLCLKELLSVAEKYKRQEEKLSWLGKRIDDQPETELPREIKEVVDNLTAE